MGPHLDRFPSNMVFCPGGQSFKTPGDSQDKARSTRQEQIQSSVQPEIWHQHSFLFSYGVCWGKRGRLRVKGRLPEEGINFGKRNRTQKHQLRDEKSGI